MRLTGHLLCVRSFNKPSDCVLKECSAQHNVLLFLPEGMLLTESERSGSYPSPYNASRQGTIARMQTQNGTYIERLWFVMASQVYLVETAHKSLNRLTNKGEDKVPLTLHPGPLVYYPSTMSVGNNLSRQPHHRFAYGSACRFVHSNKDQLVLVVDEHLAALAHGKSTVSCYHRTALQSSRVRRWYSPPKTKKFLASVLSEGGSKASVLDPEASSTTLVPRLPSNK
eukprot:scaffold1233_cov395-Prasinococcus_capsulatus_cf.AAC.3